MSSTTDLLIKNLAKTITETPGKKSAPYDTQAEVRRIEGDIAWVHIPGGVDETPVQLTTNAKKGDIVQVRVSGGQAWITGNATKPPTDDTTAKAAQKTAAVADEHATDAVASAILAQQFADEAKKSAGEAKIVTDEIVAYSVIAEKSVTQILSDGEAAGDAAKEAKNAANDAKNQAQNSENEAKKAAHSAISANEYARAALSSLSDIEDVVDVLGWVSEHGTYSLTTDTQVDPSKAYYKLTATNTYERVPIPVSTVLADMYELVTAYSYFKTEDTTIVSGKTYYTYNSSTGEYEEVVSPVDTDLDRYFERTSITYYEKTTDTTPVSGKTYYAYDVLADTYTAATPTATIGTYYELSLDESVRNYLLTHIALTNEGLTIINDGSSYRLVVGSDSVVIKNVAGAVVASYGSEIVLGEAANGIRNVITSTRMSFRTDAGDIAYFGLNNDGIWQMHIATTFVDDMIRFGDYAWIKRDNGNMSIKWLGA